MPPRMAAASTVHADRKRRLGFNPAMVRFGTAARAPDPAALFTVFAGFGIAAAVASSRSMGNWGTQSRLAPRLVDSLYVEAMVLADEVRGYFDGRGIDERDALPPLARVGFACESLKVTTRLMHVVSWLLTRRAIEAGEIPGDPPQQRRLGDTADSDPAIFATLPDTARALIEASRELYGRVRRLDGEINARDLPDSPALSLINRLERAF